MSINNNIVINKYLFLYNILVIGLMSEVSANDDDICGKPALYRHTMFTVVKSENQTDVSYNVTDNVFRNRTVIKYKCINPSDQIDDSINASRVCVNGKWIGRISRCAQYTTSFVKRFEVYDKSVNKSIFNSTESSTIKSLPYAFIAHYWPKDCRIIPINNTFTNKLIIHLNCSVPFNYFKITLKFKNLNHTNVSVISHISATKTCKILSSEMYDIYETLSILCQLSQHIVDHNTISSEQKQNYLKEPHNKIELMFNTSEIVFKKNKRVEVSVCELRLYTIPHNDCGEPDKPLHSVVLSNNHFAQFTCEDGYDISPLRLNGYHVMCDINSEWKDQFPVCLEKMYCDLPNAPNSTQIVLRNNMFSVVNGVNVTSRGTIAVYTCDNILFNGLPTMLNTTSNTRECRNGKWSGSEPQCISIKYNIVMSLSSDLKTILIGLGTILLFCIIIILSFIIVCCCRRNRKKGLSQTIIRSDLEMNPYSNRYESVRMSDITIGSYYEHFYEDITNSITASNNIYNARHSSTYNPYNSNPLRTNSLYTSNSSYC